MPDWQHRAFIVVPIDQVAAANALASQLDPGDGSDTFGDVLLSPSGQAPATHSACSTLLTDAGKAGVDQYLTSATIPGAAVYYEAAGWDWSAVLADLGLKVIDIQQ